MIEFLSTEQPAALAVWFCSVALGKIENRQIVKPLPPRYNVARKKHHPYKVVK